MVHPDRKSERPALKSTEVYRPRLGTQREPLSRTTMSEMRAWRDVKDAAGKPLEQAQA
jgi:hypothetical protein